MIFIPSSRVFSYPKKNDSRPITPLRRTDDIYHYEDWIPHYTETSQDFQLLDGRWQAVSQRRDELMKKRRKKAMKYMQDLLHFNGLEHTQTLYRQKSDIWRGLYQLSQIEGNKKALVAKLKSVLEQNGKVGEAIVRDFIEMTTVNHLIPEENLIKLKDVGLRP